MRRLLALAFLVTTVSASACATYTQDLDRGIKHYDASEHERALAVFRSLENDTDSFSGQERARYFYYRGMTDYRLATPEYEVRADARYWLGLARAAEDKTPGSLSEDQKKRITAALEDLDEDVYKTGAPKKPMVDAGDKASEKSEKKPEKKAKKKKESDDE